MTACPAWQIAPRNLTTVEKVLEAKTGVTPEGAQVTKYCIHPERHRCAHEYRTARWIAVRAVARFTVALVIVGAFIILTGEPI